MALKRKIITKLKLNEISGVDDPAQPGAVTTLMKRAPTRGPNPTKDGDPPQETEMFKNRAELLAAIAKFQSDGGTDADITAIKKSATDLKLTDLLPSGGALALSQGTDETLTKRFERLEKVSKLSGEHKSHFDALKDEAAQDAFLAKSDAERNEDINKAKGDDPVVYTTLEGLDIRKSAGEVVLTLAKQADQTQRQLVAERRERQEEQLAKRAGEVLSNFTGEDIHKRALLRAVDGISDQATREAVLKSLEAANTAASNIYTRKGANPSEAPTRLTKASTPADAEAQLETLAKNHARDHKVSFSEAYDAVLSTPEGSELYNISVGA